MSTTPKSVSPSLCEKICSFCKREVVDECEAVAEVAIKDIASGKSLQEFAADVVADAEAKALKEISQVQVGVSEDKKSQ